MTGPIWFALAAAAAQVSAVQLPDPDMFGRSTGEAVKLLVDKKTGDVEPMVVWSDVRCGKYVAASAFYDRPATTDLVKAQIRTVYASARETEYGWIQDRSFSITVAEEDNLVGKVVVVRFIHASAVEPCDKSDGALP